MDCLRPVSAPPSVLRRLGELVVGLVMVFILVANAVVDAVIFLGALLADILIGPAFIIAVVWILFLFIGGCAPKRVAPPPEPVFAAIVTWETPYVNQVGEWGKGVEWVGHQKFFAVLGEARAFIRNTFTPDEIDLLHVRLEPVGAVHFLENENAGGTTR